MASLVDPRDSAHAPSPAAGSVRGMGEPVDGSWIAELEEAEAALNKALRALPPETEQDDDSEDRTASNAAVLHAYLRLCRAYSKLRLWNRLLSASNLGLKACASSSVAASSFSRPAASAGRSLAVPRNAGAEVAAEASFREYLETAKAELAVPTLLYQTNASCAPHRNAYEMIRHSVLERKEHPGCDLEEAVVLMDVRLLEALLALGAALDMPIAVPEEDEERSDEIFLHQFPPGASALLVACATLAIWESTDPVVVRYRASYLQRKPDELDQLAECIMQLVNLGADPNLVMPLGVVSKDRSFAAFAGKSSYQIAIMSKRQPLVALMRTHMQLSPTERAEIVHCRCGSRLPWKQCHSTGDWQPPHCFIDEEGGAHYRLSPLGRCPCMNTNKTYYECCWWNNETPVYRNDRTGGIHRERQDTLGRLKSFWECAQSLLEQDPEESTDSKKSSHGWYQYFARQFREHPPLFAALCDDAGPKSRMKDWSNDVYAGCVERLEKNHFLWTDVHWKLDRAELLLRCDAWNEALRAYCDDAGLEGAERERIVSTHAANPCGPCGYVGCSAFEETVREFPRCARCKAVAYCGRGCQKKDWTEHKKVCQASTPVYVGNEPVNAGQS